METVLTTAPKPFVFVLMPFAQEFDDTYKFGIKGACEAAGAYSERVDEQHFDGSIFERIRNQIAKADVIVADMSGKNANVFYEVGYAHALNKRVVLVTKNSSDIPFDLKHYPHIIHEGSISSLKDMLTDKLRWALKQPASSLQANPLDLLDLTVIGEPIDGAFVLTKSGIGSIEIAVMLPFPEESIELRSQLFLRAPWDSIMRRSLVSVPRDGGTVIVGDETILHPEIPALITYPIEFDPVLLVSGEELDATLTLVTKGFIRKIDFKVGI